MFSATSQSLGGQTRAKQQRKKALEMYYSSPNYCLYCNSIIEVPPFVKVGIIRKKKFCNRSHAAKFNNKGRSRKKVKTERSSISIFNPIRFNHLLGVTKSNLFARYPAWQTARSMIAKHARYLFFKFKDEKCCFVCGYSNHIDVCHIVPVNQFRDNAFIFEINHLDNLVGLCPNHHWELDHGLLKITDVK